MPWATTVEAGEITGTAVTDEQLGRAQSVIELFVGRTESETSSLRMTTSQLSWLKKAVAYQAAWMGEQADIFTRSAVDLVIQDGAHVKYGADGQTLAPFARKALKRLGWKGTRTIFPARIDHTSAGRYYAADGVGGVHDFADDNWRAM